MTYCVTDNRIVIESFFFEQDSQGKIHVFENLTMEYVECVDYVGVLPNDIFIDKCREWLNSPS